MESNVGAFGGFRRLQSCHEVQDGGRAFKLSLECGVIVVLEELTGGVGDEVVDLPHDVIGGMGGAQEWGEDGI